MTLRNVNLRYFLYLTDWKMMIEERNTWPNQPTDQPTNKIKILKRNGKQLMVDNLMRKIGEWNERIGWEFLVGNEIKFEHCATTWRSSLNKLARLQSQTQTWTGKIHQSWKIILSSCGWFNLVNLVKMDFITARSLTHSLFFIHIVWTRFLVDLVCRLTQ